MIACRIDVDVNNGRTTVMHWFIQDAGCDTPGFVPPLNGSGKTYVRFGKKFFSPTLRAEAEPRGFMPVGGGRAPD